MRSWSSPFIPGLTLAILLIQPLQADFSEDLERLQLARDEAVTRAITPIDRKFRESLEALMRRATQAGDLEAANAIKDKLEELRPKPAEMALEDTTWVARGPNSVMRFKKGGDLTEEWPGGPSENTWKRISRTEVQVVCKRTGKEFKFTLNEAGKEIKREEDGLVWKLRRTRVK